MIVVESLSCKFKWTLSNEPTVTGDPLRITCYGCRLERLGTKAGDQQSWESGYWQLGLGT
jgi:hypothetical protein